MIKIKLREILDNKRITITQLHDLTGISRSTLTLLANNESKGIQFETLDSLCIALEVTPAELFYFTLEPNEDVLDFVAHSSFGEESHQFLVVNKVKVGKKEFWYGVEIKITFPRKKSKEKTIYLHYRLESYREVFDLVREKYPNKEITEDNFLSYRRFNKQNALENYINSTTNADEEQEFKLNEKYLSLIIEQINNKKVELLNLFEEKNLVAIRRRYSNFSELSDDSKKSILEENPDIDEKDSFSVLNLYEVEKEKNNLIIPPKFIGKRATLSGRLIEKSKYTII
ncbi:helix-turn-helix domain-containing protein [Vagococcus acidifermentans]|uniref:helix-turn-helix domain-containing protein n=1 Tax=Vagococcus acidifermentans TaxID=564710 RepID=UPI0014770D49|nr:helix-turn-helix transcriptional regulator [Vagococcus acidifermentans]